MSTRILERRDALCWLRHNQQNIISRFGEYYRLLLLDRYVGQGDCTVVLFAQNFACFERESELCFWEQCIILKIIQRVLSYYSQFVTGSHPLRNLFCLFCTLMQLPCFVPDFSLFPWLYQGFSDAASCISYFCAVFRYQGAKEKRIKSVRGKLMCTP